jgi:hypothetical protein
VSGVGIKSLVEDVGWECFHLKPLELAAYIACPHAHTRPHFSFDKPLPPSFLSKALFSVYTIGFGSVQDKKACAVTNAAATLVCVGVASSTPGVGGTRDLTKVPFVCGGACG